MAHQRIEHVGTTFLGSGEINPEPDEGAPPRLLRRHALADPVEAGLVESLNRPGGNLTGATVASDILVGKQVEVLHKLVPTAAEFGYLSVPGTPLAAKLATDVDQAARMLGWKVTQFRATNAGEFNPVFEALAQHRIGALLVQDTTLFNTNPQQLAVLAARHRIAALYIFRNHPEAGSFASSGPNQTETWRQGCVYVTRILRGEKPADLPVQQPTKYELVLNLKTAKALSLDIPPAMLALADEVIE
jgi:ABC-type uncharacterized transport system substrate-binding protein